MGPGLQSYTLGETGGLETVILGPSQMAQHTHTIALGSLTGTLRCRNGAGNQLTPIGGVPAIGAFAALTDATLVVGSSPVRAVHITELRVRVDAVRTGVGLQPFGGNQAHANVQPYLALNYLISLFGVFPPQN